MNYYLSRNYRDTNSAGNKAKTDIEDIMADMGFRNAGSPRSFHHGSARAFLATLARIGSFCYKAISPYKKQHFILA